MNEGIPQILTDRLQEIEGRLAATADGDSRTGSSPNPLMQLVGHYRAVLADLSTSGALVPEKRISGNELRD